MQNTKQQPQLGHLAMVIYALGFCCLSIVGEGKLLR